jgi:hypothetical protein
MPKKGGEIIPKRQIKFVALFYCGELTCCIYCILNLALGQRRHLLTAMPKKVKNLFSEIFSDNYNRSF